MTSYDACLVEAELRARSAYAEPNRYYHSERHLDECLRELGGVTDITEASREVLQWAILWHDAIYDATRSDNEELSADLAAEELTACKVDKSIAEEVARLIMLTKGHRVEAADSLGALLVSIDLSILGSDEGRYREYVEGVRKEYAHVPDEAWRVGRSAVLTHLLRAESLYPDPTFRARFEEQARKNMQTELSTLRVD